MAEPQEEQAAEPKSGGLMSILPIALIAAAGTFGMVWFAAAPAAAPSECEVLTPATPLTPEEMQARTANYVELDPITVSLGPEAGARHLRISVVLGTPSDVDDFSDVQYLRLKDRFLERLRLVDSSIITDPAAMPALKEELLSQARATLGDDAVYSVLVTEFLMK